MKKTICAILALLLVCLPAAACRREAPPEETEAPTTGRNEPTSAEEAPAPEPLTEEEKERLRGDLPGMDGSTSLIPLEAGLREALLGLSYREAYLQVKHSKTWAAFYGLVSEKRTDLLFTTPLSETQRKFAEEEEGVALEETPITREGFVFVVNAKNPVRSLTQAQLRSIYTGEITNWKELGGADAPIVAYQRNPDSGSQNFMVDFMGELPLMDAPTELRPTEMGFLMDAVAVNDNAENAIGYSVYAYAADMYRNTETVRFIEVDGVAPSRATIASGEYPLAANNYAVLRADEPEGSPARLMVRYILSDEGQRAIAEAGYAAVRDIGFDYTDAPGSVYREKGRGGKAPETLPDVEYVSYAEESAYDPELIPLAPVFSADGTYTYTAQGLPDSPMKREIDAFLDESVKALAPSFGDYRAVLAGIDSMYAPEADEAEQTRAYLSVRNAMLSATVSLEFTKTDYSFTECCFDVRTAVWDLRTGRRLAPEALFCSGVDIGEELTAWLRRQCDDMEYGSPDPLFDMPAEPLALPTDGWAVNADFLYFTKESPFFVYGARIPLRGMPDGTMAAEAPCAPEELSLLGAFPVYPRLIETKAHMRYMRTDSGAELALLDPEAYPAAAEINREVLTYVRTWFSEEAFAAYERENGEKVYLEGGPSATEYQGRFFLFSTGWAVTDGGEYPYTRNFMFDLRTGEEVLSADELFLDGWTARAEVPVDENETPVSPELLGSWPVGWIWFEGPVCDLSIRNPEPEGWYRYYSVRASVADFRF